MHDMPNALLYCSGVSLSSLQAAVEAAKMFQLAMAQPWLWSNSGPGCTAMDTRMHTSKQAIRAARYSLPVAC